MTARHRYDRQGFLALDPKAFMEMFVEASQSENIATSDATIVEIMGPLEHHSGWFCDSYDAIGDRVSAACQAAPQTIILKIDSPGGDVSGCFDTAREIKAKCAAAGKTLIAYVDGSTCSAAYALACAASTIVIPEGGIAGSIGVISTRVDVSGMDTQMGVKFSLITSGARKADGHPHTVMSDAELASSQTLVDALAGVFFQLVADSRPMSVADVKALQANVFHGADAVAKGLADKVQSFDELLASLAAGADTGAVMADDKENDMDTARAALEKAAKSEDEAEAKRAKKALAAMDASDEGEPDGDEPDEDDKKKDAKAARAGRVSASTATGLASSLDELSKRLARFEQEREASDRSAFLATRGDLSKDLLKALQEQPLADVKRIVNAIPAPKKQSAAHAANAPTINATRGDDQGVGGGSRLPKEESEELARQMGLGKAKGAIKHEGNRMYLGVMTAEQAREYAATRKTKQSA